MTDPIIFLDFDGVLNSIDSRKAERSNSRTDKLDPLAIERLNRLVALTGAKVVVSSTWRLCGKVVGYFSGLGGVHPVEEMARVLASNGFIGNVIGVTPYLNTSREFTHRDGSTWRCSPRGDEIQRWRQDNGHTGPFVALDDDSDMPGCWDQLVQTSHDHGLLDEHVERAAALLSIPATPNADHPEKENDR